jgi:hypothetical protein
VLSVVGWGLIGLGRRGLCLLLRELGMLVGIVGMLAAIDFVAGRGIVKKGFGMMFATGFGRGLSMLMGRWKKLDLGRIGFGILAGTKFVDQRESVGLMRTDWFLGMIVPKCWAAKLVVWSDFVVVTYSLERGLFRWNYDRVLTRYSGQEIEIVFV